MIRRTLPSTAMALMLVVAAVVVLGRPDPAAAARFLGGGTTTMEDAEALVALISWVVIAAVAVGSIAGSVRALTRSQLMRQRSRRAALVFAAGVLLIAVATVQRSLPVSVNVCCGDEVTAAHEVDGLGGR